VFNLAGLVCTIDATRLSSQNSSLAAAFTLRFTTVTRGGDTKQLTKETRLENGPLLARLFGQCSDQIACIHAQGFVAGPCDDAEPDLAGFNSAIARMGGLIATALLGFVFAKQNFVTALVLSAHVAALVGVTLASLAGASAVLLIRAPPFASAPFRSSHPRTLRP
jgi:hypothetical protein